MKFDNKSRIDKYLLSSLILLLGTPLVLAGVLYSQGVKSGLISVSAFVLIVLSLYLINIPVWLVSRKNFKKLSVTFEVTPEMLIYESQEGKKVFPKKEIKNIILLKDGKYEGLKIATTQENFYISLNQFSNGFKIKEQLKNDGYSIN
ncbi:hypothetical protein [Carboxydothermus ferrireducens]|uniref:PH domain-containing protein n=1 Tax=Carboxydothermus ferrireducens DSM 11255 TaxID=1119529 RepID=A0ABX2RB42_9THEO|nr:hypothetical protein [Carboxydothermus ferrireducens]NYE58384.1 hypothetical protein [Carboxydothermus ferrireducens DSM 11255]